jgi:rhodanese-related sulfurtransferase
VERSKEKKNQLAILIGGILILLVSIISVTKNQIAKNETQSNSNISATSSDSNAITSDQLQQRIRLDKNLKIIDVRDPNVFQTEHIFNSANVDVKGVAAFISGVGSKDFNFVLIDDDGTLGPRLVSEVLKNVKEAKLFALKGGFADWKKQYGATIKDADPASFSDQAKVKYITTDDLKSMLDKSSNLFIIDVRESSAFTQGHIKNATNIPLAQVEASQDKIPLGKQIIVYDDNGLLAFKAAVKLFDMGIFDAKTLFDGFQTWQQKGFEVQK